MDGQRVGEGEVPPPEAWSTSGVTDQVQVTDSLGNTAVAEVQVVAPLAVQPVSPQTPPLGTISFTAAGGAAPVTYVVWVRRRRAERLARRRACTWRARSWT